MDHLSALRRFELEFALRYFPATGSSVLEVGGGSGWQAQLLSEKGFRVESIDVARPEAALSFPVRLYDGEAIPYPEQSFDLVFSSNVLEHVEDVELLLCEMARVLRPNGRMVHILPTPAWRFWTLVMHYPFLVKYAVGGVRSNSTMQHRPTLRGTLAKRGLHETLQRVLIPPPHGVGTSALHELTTFSSQHWCQTFGRAGLEVVRHAEVGLFYTGHALFPGTGITARQKASRWLGSASALFELRQAKY
ncbi:MAG: hypothetical protein AMXMBFR52_14950 [Burkholderiales bacterium]|jgi:SAM-dependent methyltransferase|nr:class I SAM-dependent methyltransferase [Burkholderiaceae bacterium]